MSNINENIYGFGLDVASFAVTSLPEFSVRFDLKQDDSCVRGIYINGAGFTANTIKYIDYATRKYPNTADNMYFHASATYSFANSGDTIQLTGLSSFGRYLDLDIHFNRLTANTVSSQHFSSFEYAKITDINVDYYYTQQVKTNKFIYKWKTDIFGNQYFLLKDKKDLDIYDNKNQVGNFYIKLMNEKIIQLSDIYTFTTFTNIVDFEVIYDNLFIITDDYFYSLKMLFDYDTCELSLVMNREFALVQRFSYSGVLPIVPLQESLTTIYHYYSDIWFFEDRKKIFVFLYKIADGVLVPRIFVYNAETGDSHEVLVKSDNGEFVSVEDYTVDGIEYQSWPSDVFSYDKPVVTYNPTTNYFKYTYFGKTADNLYIFNYTYKLVNDELVLININIVTPNT